MVKIHEMEVKSILTNSNLPKIDYVINPYTGCAFGCAYCYASFMGRFVDEKMQDWGKYVYVKTNAVELLDKRLAKMKDKSKTIMLASATDAWQYIEKNYCITRDILKTLVKYDYPGKIVLLTKSDLILRDLDIIKQLKNVEVGFTITSANDELSKSVELFAPKVSKRLAALQAFNEAGLKTYVFIAPVLPHFMTNLDELDNMFKQIKQTGNDEIFIDMLNTKDYIAQNLEITIAKLPNDVQKSYTKIKTKEKEVLEFKREIMKLIKKYDLVLRNKKS